MRLWTKSKWREWVVQDELLADDGPYPSWRRPATAEKEPAVSCTNDPAA
jgi:hypothetical protein